jgi:alanine racemase
MSTHVTVRVDLGQVRRNVEAVARKTGVPVIAVVKADAYGLGARRVAYAIADLVEGYYTFSLMEALEAGLRDTGRSTIALEPQSREDAGPYVSFRVHPAVWDTETATRLRQAQPVLSVDTGQHRFGAAPELIDEVLRAGEITEAFTHATRVEHVQKLVEAVGARGLRLHAAGTALLDEPSAWLDAVRPGLALYRGAARVSARLVEARDSSEPSGYTGFVVPRHGVILAGYSDGLRKGPCVVNGQRQRVLEVGMQSAFIELAPGDKVGDEVVLLGDGVSEADVGQAWGSTPHEALLRLAQLGPKAYVE